MSEQEIACILAIQTSESSDLISGLSGSRADIPEQNQKPGAGALEEA